MDLPAQPKRIVRRKRRRVKVPGGKALARIRYFRLQRGLSASPPPKQPRTRSVAATRLPTRTAVEDAYLKAQRRKLRLATPPKAPVWVELGPRSIPHGQTYGHGGNNQPPVSGRIAAVAVDPTNSKRILIASAGGGIWESHDRGLTWDPLTDFQPTLSFGALMFAPSNPQYVYAGTGEGDTQSVLGMGVLRSTDAGASWRLLAVPDFVGQAFYDIAVDPKDHRHVWAAMTNGLYESSNAGAAWTRVRTGTVWDLSIDPNGSGELFACGPSGLARSTNGVSWKKVALPKSPAEFERMEVCHAPSDPAVVYVFACTQKSGRLWRREAVAGAFAVQDLPASLDVGQGWYDWCAAVHPSDPNTLYIGAIELLRGTRRPSGSWTWRNLSSRKTGDSIHPDQHHLFVSAAEPDTLYVANDGGLFRSPDQGQTWKALNKGLGITEFEFLAQHPTNLSWILGGTQDNGTLRRGESPLLWNQTALGDGGDCGVNDANPPVCYHSYYGMGFDVSTAGGAAGSWAFHDPTPEAYKALFYPPLEVFNDLLAQAGQSVFITEDQGGSFAEVDLPAFDGEQEIASVLAIARRDTILVGTVAGNVYRIDQMAGDWQAPVALTRPRLGYVSDICVDADIARVWVTYSTIEGGGHVYLSANGGGSWVDRGSKLPKIAVNAIAVDPAHVQTVFVGTDNGVYRSDDEGKTWADFSNGLPNALVGDLLFHAAKRRLRAGTRNRGVWEVHV